METGSSNGRRVRFGAFEADLQAGELRKSGIRVRLQDQPFRVLALLLSCSGDVVTREELRAKIWPDDTFVDFDHSLNTAINKIREALGDSASHPRFVETIPRRGYRFVFPLQRAAGRDGARAGVEPPPRDTRSELRTGRPSVEAVRPLRLQRAVLLAILAVAGVGLVMQWRGSFSPRAPSAVTRMRVPLKVFPQEPVFPGRKELAFSPDGSQFVYTGVESTVPELVTRLYLQPLDQLDPIAMEGTEGRPSPSSRPTESGWDSGQPASYGRCRSGGGRL